MSQSMSETKHYTQLQVNILGKQHFLYFSFTIFLFFVVTLLFYLNKSSFVVLL